MTSKSRTQLGWLPGPCGAPRPTRVLPTRRPDRLVFGGGKHSFNDWGWMSGHLCFSDASWQCPCSLAGEAWLGATEGTVSRRLGLGQGPVRSRAGSGQWHRGTGGRSSEYSYQSPQRASVEINFVSVSAFRLDGSPARHASCHLAPLQTAEKGARWPWPRPVSGRQTICSSQPGMENFHLPARLVPPSLRTPQWGAGHFTVSR